MNQPQHASCPVTKNTTIPAICILSKDLDFAEIVVKIGLGICTISYDHYNKFVPVLREPPQNE